MKFIIDHDLHIHSQLSRCSNHAEQTAENILKYAKENGLKHICITDHFWDEKVPGASQWYSTQGFANISKILPLPKEDGIRFDFGCETDMNMDMTLGIARSTIDKLDFVIVPTNHLHNTGVSIPEGMNSVSERAKFFMARNHALLDMDLPFEKMGLAHFTCSLLTYYGEGTSDELLDYITDAEYIDLFNRIAKCGMGVELNTSLQESASQSALRPYRIARECGCKFYLGSDAHTPRELAAAMPRFRAIVDALDLTENDKHPFVCSK